MQKAPQLPALNALSATQIAAHLAQLDGWKLHSDGADLAIEKTLHFAGYLQTMTFVNAVAVIAESTNHHPELVIHHQHCSVRWYSHDVQGLSVRDFACAAKVDALLNLD